MFRYIRTLAGTLLRNSEYDGASNTLSWSMREMTRCMRYPMDFLSVNNLFSYLPSVPDIFHIRTVFRDLNAGRAHLPDHAFLSPSWRFAALPPPPLSCLASMPRSCANTGPLRLSGTRILRLRSRYMWYLCTIPHSDVLDWILVSTDCAMLMRNRCWSLFLFWAGIPRFYAHFTHVNRYGTLWYGDSSLIQHMSDLGRAIDHMRFFVDGFDLIHDPFLTGLRAALAAFPPAIISRCGDTQFSQHTGNRKWLVILCGIPH